MDRDSQRKQNRLRAMGRRRTITHISLAIRFRRLLPSIVLPMIGAKWSGVFPLRVGDFVSFANRDPSVFANRNTRALIRVLEPRNDAGRFRSVAVCRFVV